MGYFLLILFLAATLVVAGLAWHYHRRFAATPARRWAVQVRARRHELQAALQRLRSESEARWDPSTLERKLFERQLARVPLDTLDAYVGIGQGTIDTLRAARLRYIANLQGYRFESLHGIGPGKAESLRKAVKAIITDARAAFDAARSDEGREFRQAVRDERDREATGRHVREGQAAALEAALAEDEPRSGIAARVTLIAFLFGQDTGFNIEMARETLRSTSEVIDAARPARGLPPVGILVSTPLPPPLPPQAPVVAVSPERKPSPKPFDPSSASKPSPVVTKPSPLLAELRWFAALGTFAAQVDGEAVAVERIVVRRLLGEQYGHDPELVRHIDAALEDAWKDRPTRSDIAAGFGAHGRDATSRRRSVDFVKRVIDADGGRNQAESACLDWLTEAMGLKDEPTNPKPVVAVSARPPAPLRPVPTPALDPFAEHAAVAVSSPTPPHPRLDAMRFFAGLGIFIARSDGRIAAAERAAVRSFLEENFGHDAALVRHLDAVIEEGERGRTTAADVEAGARTHCPGDADKRRAYNFALRVADAASGRTERELAKLKWLFGVLGLVEEKRPIFESAPAPMPAPPPPVVIPSIPPVKPAPVVPVPAATPPAARENSLLDEAFAAPVATPSVPVASTGDLRENALLDDVFGT